MKKAASKTIKKKIMQGYVAIIVVICILVVGALACLTIVQSGYQNIVGYWSQQATAETVITAHYKWLEGLNTSIVDGAAFKGSLDPETCALGKWLSTANPEALGDAQLTAALNEIKEPHKEIHHSAADLVALSKTDLSAAYEGYKTDIKPRVEKTVAGLAIVGERYAAISETNTAAMGTVVVVSFLFCAALGVFAVVIAVIYANKIAEKISKPLQVVTRWSEAMSTGINNLEMGQEKIETAEPILEIERMTTAFRSLVQGIQNDVAVIQRIAAGDMTVYVDIKSEGDLLGQNLYSLVQNNDMMFADLLRVADNVACNAQSIAEANQQLADQTTTQAMAVESLSHTILQANDLAEGNARKASAAAEVTQQVKGQVLTGRDKMLHLLKAVEEINEASQKISGVMKVIDDISFQTNILALNAAVEAARAGSAGKGFAVVADEVRNLALKSGEAAKHSNDLMQNAIRKTNEGTAISQETFAMFEHIVDSTNTITDIVQDISTASGKQQTYIDEIHGEITQITEVVSSNAATSEQTAASSQEMTDNAALIRKTMHQFQLRQRVQGQAYIPPEKMGDSDFVQLANVNYRKYHKDHAKGAD